MSKRRSPNSIASRNSKRVIEGRKPPKTPAKRGK